MAVVSEAPNRSILKLPQKSPAASPPTRKQVADNRAKKMAEVIDWLRTLPCCKTVQPLAIGIHARLSHLRSRTGTRISVSSLRRALKWWTAQRSYIAALAADGSQRVDVDGQIVGPVSEAHRTLARSMLAD